MTVGMYHLYPAARAVEVEYAAKRAASADRAPSTWKAYQHVTVVPSPHIYYHAAT